jgi:hypothetical protein
VPLLYGGYKALTAFPWMRRLKLPLALGAGALGAHALRKRPGQTMVTDEGYEIPTMTEMTMKSASQQAIVHFVECASKCQIPAMKIAAESTLDDVAMALGAIILT